MTREERSHERKNAFASCRLPSAFVARPIFRGHFMTAAEQCHTPSVLSIIESKTRQKNFVSIVFLTSTTDTQPAMMCWKEQTMRMWSLIHLCIDLDVFSDAARIPCLCSLAGSII